MSPTYGAHWNEDNLSEAPAVALLQRLGYTFVPADTLDAERASPREAVLTQRLAKALKKLNPWLSAANIQKAIRAVTGVQAASLIEANEKLHRDLTYGISLEQDRGDGKKGHTVRFFDFDDPAKNELLVTRQLTLKGSHKNIRPDLLVYVNGLPLAVIECKSPTLGEQWKTEAINQLLRYQEIGEQYRNLGAPQLFAPAQLLIVTCGKVALYGTVGAAARTYADWKVPYPRTVAQIEKELGHAPSAQDVLFYGLLHPENLLDIVQNFVVFEKDRDTHRLVRKVCRYQQFAAVNKAMDRARRARTPGARGGVVWHTQGSGKSLTMLWLALKLRRDPLHENPTIVLVTDRVDLDEQITGTFQRCGFPNPVQADSVKHLRQLLAGPSGQTVLTTVHKFQEITGTPTRTGGKRSRVAQPSHPVLSTAENLFVLADEAHRTQYGGLAANMRQALPSAAFFGFTGTPIDKKDRSTLQTFGDYIDKYTILQSVTDGATVPIVYESRLPDLRILGQSLDKLFDRVFANRSAEEREAIKKKYATEKTLACAPRRIEAICLDLLDHYAKVIQPNGFKVQIVTVSREGAVLYKETLDRLHGPQSAVIMSGTNKDEEHLVKHHIDETERKKLIKRFLNHKDPLAFLIVCDMLLTGFDAPVEQVMYLDSPLREHTLLQAIARVNRPAERKTYGLVVDYWGITEALTEALDIFTKEDVQGAMTPKTDELPRLQARHAAVLRFFSRVKDKNDLDACVAVLAAEDVRAEFDVAFRRFGQSLDMLLPDPRALPYLDDLRWVGKIRQVAAALYRDSKIDISDCGAKVKKLIEDAVIADGIQILVERVALFSKEFDARLAAMKSDGAKASEMEHALKDEIHVKLDEDPAFYTSLRERLEQILEDRKARRIDAAKQLELMMPLLEELAGRARAADELGLSQTGHAVYGLLEEVRPLKVAEARDQRYGQAEGGSEANKELTRLILEHLEPQMGIVEWSAKEDVQREMRRLAKRQLIAAQFPQEQAEALARRILEVLMVRQGR